MTFAKARHWPLWACLAAAFWLCAAAQAAPGDTPPKPAITGFIDMQTIAWHNADNGMPVFTLDNVKRFPGLFGGIVLNATWGEMQPHQWATLITTRIDDALDQVRRYNRRHPAAPLGVKLRIFAGNQAPPWAKAIDGGPLTIKRNPQGCPSGDCPITIGKVWDAQYIAAWRALQRLVAARYDADPLIRSVAITSCTMQTDEPFVMPEDQPPPPGYTDAAGKHCLSGAVADYAPWQRTVIDFTINSFHRIVRGGSAPHFSIAVMDACRAALGTRCELGNHAFASSMPPLNALIVDAISRRGAPIHYQTVGPHVPGFNWVATVRAARRKHATGLELWPDAQFGGFMALNKRQMQTLSDLFNGD